jgi:hypothetical protein
VEGQAEPLLEVVDGHDEHRECLRINQHHATRVNAEAERTTTRDGIGYNVKNLGTAER